MDVSDKPKNDEWCASHYNMEVLFEPNPQSESLTSHFSFLLYSQDYMTRVYDEDVRNVLKCIRSTGICNRCTGYTVKSFTLQYDLVYSVLAV